MNSVQKETIKLYAKQLRVPTFNNYDKVIRQLSADDGYEQFLIELMKQELAERSVTGQKRRIKAAKFPSPHGCPPVPQVPAIPTSCAPSKNT